ncbi:MAG TPA: histidinol dehydrogenase [Clostridia bacterium]|jgi:histidinol dehydrogenase|nr:histidinol dehydrogenase [Clostridia bacterium]
MISIVNANGKSEFEFLDSIRKKTLAPGANVDDVVKDILLDVKQNGDSAVIKYSKKFDGTSTIKKYQNKQFKEAFNALDDRFKEVLLKAASRITEFHTLQLQKPIQLIEAGKKLGQIIRPINSVGLYVPGGTAAYPSSVLMNAIPAKIAGVKEIVIVTPPTKGGVNKDVLAAAFVAGVDALYAVGGAQAVGALAYGTKTVPKVDKIVGPGNIYVATAKKMVFGECDIDMIAGPSEITIIADKDANPKYVAADLLSQAEHDKLASSILLTNSMPLAEEVKKELIVQTAKLERKDIMLSSLENCGGIIVCQTIEECVDIANYIAPEHLEIMTKNPEELLDSVNNAGSVFLGEYTPEAVGDYLAGTNHVLPTGGSARFFSPLSVDSFIKKIQYASYSRSMLSSDADSIINFATREGLTAHANAVKVRTKNK